MPELLTDYLRCLWGGDRAAHLGPLTDPEHAARFGPTAAADRLAGLIGDLEADPERAYSWQMLWLHVGPARLSPPLAQRLDAVIAGLDLNRAIESDPLVLTPLMELAVRHAEDRQRIAACVLNWAAGVDARTQPSPAFVDQFGGNLRAGFMERLVHWVHGLAVQHPDDPDGEFARLLEELIMRSRTLAEHLRVPLTNIARTLPCSRHRALRRSLLCARSRPLPEVAATKTPAGRKGR
ncbi:MAG: hypothetical protein WCA32_06670 [Chromatiaceae bacterium]